MAKKKPPTRPPATAPDQSAERKAAKQVTVARAKLRKAMEDPDFRARVARHIQELLRQD